MTQPGRNWSSNDYRYGYNGKEEDNDVKDGKSVDYGARWLDPRIGRWMSTDPKEGEMPDKSPYQMNFNNPILFIDPDGKKPWPSNIVKKIDSRATWWDGFFVSDLVCGKLITVLNYSTMLYKMYFLIKIKKLVVK